MRVVYSPVLVAARAFASRQKFLIAFEGRATTGRCTEIVRASPLLKGIPRNLLIIGESGSEGDRLVWAREKLNHAGFAVDVYAVAGTADTAIAHHVQDHAIELIVMGAYGHSRIRSLILGSTTTQILRTCLVPALLLR